MTAVKRSRLAALYVLAVLVHIESLFAWFSASDTFMLIRSSRVLDREDFIQTFTEPMMHETSFTSFALFYRPLANLTYAVDYWLWGLSPVGYHASNLLVHGLVVVLVAVTVTELTRRSIVGLLTGALFALHPLTAEVVPVIARRHDALMLVFLLASLTLFVRSRRTGSTRLYWWSVVSYPVALAAKEPALLLPALVATWVVLDRGIPHDVDAVLADARELVPFAVVTLGYLLIRVAVLGSLGGYIHRDPLSFENALAAGAKYLLALWYPVDAIGVGVIGRGVWVVVSLVAAMVGALVLARTIPAAVRTDSPGRTALLAGVVAGLLAVPALLTVDPSVLRPALGVLGYLEPMADYPFPLPYKRAASPLVGLSLVATVIAAGSFALLSSRSLLERDDRQALVFFTVWLLLPPGLFVTSGDFQIRSGYPSLVPAMAVLAVLLTGGARAFARRAGSGPRAWFDVDVVPAAVALLLVLPMVAATPLVHPYGGWESAGEINRMTLTGLDDELAETPEGMPVRLIGFPNGIEEQRESFPRVRSISFLKSGAVEAWLVMYDSPKSHPVELPRNRRRELGRRPVDTRFRTETRSNRVTVHIQYNLATTEDESKDV